MPANDVQCPVCETILVNYEAVGGYMVYVCPDCQLRYRKGSDGKREIIDLPLCQMHGKRAVFQVGDAGDFRFVCPECDFKPLADMPTVGKEG